MQTQLKEAMAPLPLFMPFQGSVCVYLLIEKVQFAQNGFLATISNDQQNYWFRYESHSILNARCTGTDMTAAGKQFQCETVIWKAKPFLFLRLWRISLVTLANWRLSFWLSNIFWVLNKSCLMFFFGAKCSEGALSRSLKVWPLLSFYIEERGHGWVENFTIFHRKKTPSTKPSRSRFEAHTFESIYNSLMWQH